MPAKATRPAGAPDADRRIRELLGHGRPDLKWHFALGQAFRDALASGPLAGMSVRALARRIGLGRTIVERHLDLVRTYRPKDLPTLPRTWSAVVALLSVRDPNVRGRLRKAAVTENWPITRLRREARVAQTADLVPIEPIRQAQVHADLGELFHLAEQAGTWVTRWRRWDEVLPNEERLQKLREYARRSAREDPTGRDGRDRLVHAGVVLLLQARAVKKLLQELERVIGPVQVPSDQNPGE